MSTTIYLVIATVLGSLSSGLLGWANSDPPEPFVFRKFIGNLTRCIVSAVGAVGASTALPTTLSWAVLGTAFMAGMGADHVIQTVSSIVQTMPNTPTTPSSPAAPVAPAAPATPAAPAQVISVIPK